MGRDPFDHAQEQPGPEMTFICILEPDICPLKLFERFWLIYVSRLLFEESKDPGAWAGGEDLELVSRFNDGG